MSTPGTIIRLRFEAWAVANGWSIKRAELGGPKYPDDTQYVWRGFQAAAEQGEIDLEAMRAQRDELLAALRWCVLYDGGNCLGDHPARLAQARAAIAKASS